MLSHTRLLCLVHPTVNFLCWWLSTASKVGSGLPLSWLPESDQWQLSEFRVCCVCNFSEGAYRYESRGTQSAHSLCKVSHALDRWWNHRLDSEGEDQETLLQKTIKPSTSPANAHRIDYLNLSDPISSSKPHSSSATVFRNQAIFPQPQGR